MFIYYDWKKLLVYYFRKSN